MDENLFEEIAKLDTEIIDERFSEIDKMNTINILYLINQQDQLVPLAVKEVIPTLTEVIDRCVECINDGGRLIYVGAGTSGRIGIIDAAECPPTFGTNPDVVQGVIAGGKDAMFQAVEGAEDNKEDGKKIIHKLNIKSNDVVCGLTASGRTPWVLSALEEAKLGGAFTTLITTSFNKNYPFIDKMICPKINAEIIAGSTRMKAGTAQKLIVNMISTATMIRLGKTYKNIMIDLQPKNNKLKERAKRILMEITGISKQEAEHLLVETDFDIKKAMSLYKK